MEVLFDIQPEPLAERIVVRVHRDGCHDGHAAGGVIVDGWATLSGRRQRHDRSGIAADVTACTKRRAACVATSGPSLGRKRPRRAAIAMRYRIPLAKMIAISGSIEQM
jgi:hypothetical protein